MLMRVGPLLLTRLASERKSVRVLVSLMTFSPSSGKTFSLSFFTKSEVNEIRFFVALQTGSSVAF